MQLVSRNDEFWFEKLTLNSTNYDKEKQINFTEGNREIDFKKSKCLSKFAVNYYFIDRCL